MRDAIRGETQTILRFFASQTYRIDPSQAVFLWGDSHFDQLFEDWRAAAMAWSRGETDRAWYLGATTVEMRGAEAVLVDGHHRALALQAALLAARERTTGQARADADLALGADGAKLRPPISEPAFRDVLRRRFKDADAVDPDWTPRQKRYANLCERARRLLGRWPRETAWPEAIDGLLRRTYLTRVQVGSRALVNQMFAAGKSRGLNPTPRDQVAAALLGPLEKSERESLINAWRRAEGEVHDPAARSAALDAAALARFAPPEAFKGTRGRGLTASALHDAPLNWLAEEAASPARGAAAARALPTLLRAYHGLAEAGAAPGEGAETIHFLGVLGLDLSDWAPLVLAALDPDPRAPQDNARRAGACIAFVDVAAARLAWRHGGLATQTARAALLRFAPQVRSAAPDAVADLLTKGLNDIGAKPFPVHSGLSVGSDGLNPLTARALLTRISLVVESWSGGGHGTYADLAASGGAGFSLAHLAPTPTKAGDGAAKPPTGKAAALGAWALAPSPLAGEMASVAFDPALWAKAGNQLGRLAGADPDADTAAEAERRGFALGPHAQAPGGRDIAARTQAYAKIAAEDVWPAARIARAAATPDMALAGLLGLSR